MNNFFFQPNKIIRKVDKIEDQGDMIVKSEKHQGGDFNQEVEDPTEKDQLQVDLDINQEEEKKDKRV